MVLWCAVRASGCSTMPILTLRPSMRPDRFRQRVGKAEHVGVHHDLSGDLVELWKSGWPCRSDDLVELWKSGWPCPIHHCIRRKRTERHLCDQNGVCTDVQQESKPTRSRCADPHPFCSAEVHARPCHTPPSLTRVHAALKPQVCLAPPRLHKKQYMIVRCSRRARRSQEEPGGSPGNKNGRCASLLAGQRTAESRQRSASVLRLPSV